MSLLRSIPLGGPIGYAVLASVSLFVIGQVADRRTREVAEVRARVAEMQRTAAFEPIDLGSTVAVEEQLAAYLPLAGTGLTATDVAVIARANAQDPRARVPLGPDRWSVEAVRARRPAGWTYPRWDAPAPGNLHGPPALATPRSVRLVAVDENGEPLALETLHGAQLSGDETWTVRAYRSAEGSTTWRIGSPSITPGRDVTFELIGRAGDSEWRATGRIEDAANAGPLELGTCAFERSR